MSIFGWSASVSARARYRTLPLAALYLACALSYTRASAPATPVGSSPSASGDPVRDIRSIDPVVRREAERVLLAEGPAAIPKLVAEARSDRGRAAAQQMALKMGPAAIPALMALLDDEALAIRAGSLLFSVIGPDSIDQIPALLKCTASKPAVNNYCGTSLVKIMSPKAAAHVPALRMALGAEAKESRLYAAAGLGRAGTAARSAVPDLAKLLRDPEPSVRLAAVRSLGSIGGTSAIVRKALQDLANRKDETAEIRREARSAMRRWNE